MATTASRVDDRAASKLGLHREQLGNRDWRCGNKLKATLEVPCGNDEGIVFVLRTVADEWVKNGDGDFYAHRDTDQLAPSNERKKPRERRTEEQEGTPRSRPKRPQEKDDSFAANQPAIPPTINAKSVKSVQPIKRKEWNVDDIVLNIGAFGRDGTTSRKTPSIKYATPKKGARDL